MESCRLFLGGGCGSRHDVLFRTMDWNLRSTSSEDDDGGGGLGGRGIKGTPGEISQCLLLRWGRGPTFLG